MSSNYLDSELFSVWKAAQVGVQESVVGKVLGFPVYVDPSIPENEIWLVSLGEDTSDPLCRISDVEIRDGAVYYNLRLKKPLDYVCLKMGEDAKE